MEYNSGSNRATDLKLPARLTLNCTTGSAIKQLLDEVEHDIMHYQNRGLCYLRQPSVSADNTDTRV